MEHRIAKILKISKIFENFESMGQNMEHGVAREMCEVRAEARKKSG